MDKQRFRTSKAIKKEIQRIKKERGVVLEHYHCDNCFGYHLTREGNKYWKQLKDRLKCLI